MALVPSPVNCVGPTASVYTFPFESVTELIVDVVSYHPMITTFRSPCVCASENVADTGLAEVGFEYVPCTKLIEEDCVELTVKLALAILLVAKPLATAIACTVAEADSVNGPLYISDAEALGALPLVV